MKMGSWHFLFKPCVFDINGELAKMKNFSWYWAFINYAGSVRIKTLEFILEVEFFNFYFGSLIFDFPSINLDFGSFIF